MLQPFLRSQSSPLCACVYLHFTQEPLQVQNIEGEPVLKIRDPYKSILETHQVMPEISWVRSDLCKNFTDGVLMMANMFEASVESNLSAFFCLVAIILIRNYLVIKRYNIIYRFCTETFALKPAPSKRAAPASARGPQREQDSSISSCASRLAVVNKKSLPLASHPQHGRVMALTLLPPTSNRALLVPSHMLSLKQLRTSLLRGIPP